MANNELLTKMNDIISEGLDELSQYAAGTDEFSKVLNAVAKLHKLRVDEIHLSQSQKEQENKHDLDKQRLDLDKNRAKDDTTDRTERRKIDEKRFDLDRRKLDDDIKDRTEHRKFDEKRLELEGRRIDDDANDKAARLNLEKTRLDEDVKDKTARLDLEKQKLDEEANDRAERKQLEETRMKNDETYRNNQFVLDTRRVNIEEQKLNLDRDRHVADLNSDAAQREDRRRDRYLTIGIAAAELLIPLGVYTGLALLGFGREFDGVITSDTLKRIWNNIKPTKR